MPLRAEPPLTAASRAAGDVLGDWHRRTRIHSRRLAELLQAARSRSGRRERLRALAGLAAAAGFTLGFALAWRRR
jgi:hypothetical protein